MADYWKSIDKKFCDVCKCWITDNKASVSFHENGNRHKQGVQDRIKEIHRKNKEEQKINKKMEYDLRKIEKAALNASKKDKEDNPDVSMQIQAYFDKVKKESGEDTEEVNKNGKKPNQPTILHRSDKQKKADDVLRTKMDKSDKDYNRLGGWATQENEKARAKTAFLELPSTSSKTPGISLQLAARAEEEDPITFTEKTVSKSFSSTSTTSSFGVKSEEPEVAFKKRKMSKGHMRRRGEDD